MASPQVVSASTSAPVTVLPQSAPTPVRQFRQVSGSSPDMQHVRKIFEDVLTPLYGPQEKAIKQIAESVDRVCHLLFENEIPVGIIVYKTVLSDEYKEMGVTKSIEIKSLFVVNSNNNSGRGLGSVLIDKVIEEVSKLNLEHLGIHVTVSETKKESLIFFLNKDFKIVHIWKGRYIQEVKEYLLSRTENRGSLGPAKVDGSMQGIESSKLESSSSAAPNSSRLLACIEKAHWGRIHAMLPLSDGSFITGSQDGSLRKWENTGKFTSVVRDVDPMGYDENYWITALGKVNSEYWVSGDRAGQVSLWNKAGRLIRQLAVRPPNLGHKSHPSNIRRVNCFAASTHPDRASIFIGFPTLFEEVCLIENTTSSLTKVSNNDWVYCIHPLDDYRLLAVTAGYLNLWKKNGDEARFWSREATYISEPKANKSEKTRHHISSLTPLGSSSSHFAVGIFDGSVKVVDIAAGKLLAHYKEDQQKIWTVKNISEHVFVSAGDEGVIRFWDLRHPKSVQQQSKAGGSISTLMQINPTTLVAGFTEKSNDEISQSKLLFFDIRV